MVHLFSRFPIFQVLYSWKNYFLRAIHNCTFLISMYAPFPRMNRVIHGSHFSHHFWLIFDLIFIFYCQIIESGQKMRSKMATMNDPNDNKKKKNQPIPCIISHSKSSYYSFQSLQNILQQQEPRERAKRATALVFVNHYGISHGTQVMGEHNRRLPDNALVCRFLSPDAH